MTARKIQKIFITFAILTLLLPVIITKNGMPNFQLFAFPLSFTILFIIAFIWEEEIDNLLRK